jgi:hypothetical protein
MFIAIFATRVTTQEIPGCMPTSKIAKTANVSGAITIFNFIGDSLSNIHIY